MFTKVAMDTYKCFPIWTSSSWIPFLEQILPPNCTWNGYRLALDLSPSSQQLAVTTHLTHNYCTLLLLRSGNFPRLHWTDTMTVFNVVNDGNHLQELQNSVYHSAVLESLNTETIHFQTYVDVNYFYYLHMRTSFLKLYHVFFKHTVYFTSSHLQSFLSNYKFVLTYYQYSVDIFLLPWPSSWSSQNIYEYWEGCVSLHVSPLLHYSKDCDKLVVWTKSCWGSSILIHSGLM
jgi:hypothetical protein